MAKIDFRDVTLEMERRAEEKKTTCIHDFGSSGEQPKCWKCLAPNPHPNIPQEDDA